MLFDTFDNAKTRAGSGFFFAIDRKQAAWYADGGGEPERAFLVRSSKTLDLRCIDYKNAETMRFIREFSDEHDEWVDRASGEGRDAADFLETGDLYDYEGNGSGQRWHSLFRIARACGYDAVIAPDLTDGTNAASVVAFNNAQIEKVDNPLEFQVNRLRPLLAAAAQEVYDHWEQDADGFDDEFGTGGICDGVSSAMGGVLAKNGIDNLDISQDGDDHSVIAAIDERLKKAVVVDIPASHYEYGAGYNWKKREGISFTPEDLVVHPMPYCDVSPDEPTLCGRSEIQPMKANSQLSI